MAAARRNARELLAGELSSFALFELAQLLVELVESDFELRAITRVSCGFDTTEDESARKQQ